MTQTTLEGLYTAALGPGESLSSASHSPVYDRAKAGDVEAAADVVEAVLRRELVWAFAARASAARVVAVHAEEAAGRNKLPQAYAVAVAHLLGLEVDESVVQTNRTRHTGATARQRLARPLAFVGPVDAGRSYVIVDDVVTTGSSLAGLRHYIEARGGRVVLATTLAAAPSRWGNEPRVLAIRPATAASLESKFDVRVLNAILIEHGTAPSISHLTEAQGQTLLGFRSIDAVRSSLASGRQAKGDAAP